MSTFSGQVAQSTDDGQQSSTGTISLTAANTLLSGFSGDARYWAFRIENVTVPAGATITAASISVYAPNSSEVAMDATIYGNKTANPSTLSTSASYISGLASTTNTATWSATLTSGQFNQSPDISAIITELIGQGGWASGNAMLFVLHELSNINIVEIENYDGSPSEAAELSITYTASGAPGTPTGLTVGPDATHPTTSLDLGTGRTRSGISF
jgi:hypothetical protein